MILTFWILLAVLFYSYVGYGALIIILSKFYPSADIKEPENPLDIVILIAAHNESSVISNKLQSVLDMDKGFHNVEIIVVTDGCADDTAQKVRAYSEKGVKLIEIREHVGKINALNTALADIDCDVVVFTDANSILTKDSLTSLIKHFGNPVIGGVCGQLTVPKKSKVWLGGAESLYWHYDNALKMAENNLGGAVSAQGSLYAIRRNLVYELPSAVADDLVNSLRVVVANKKLILEKQAVAEEEVSTDLNKEFRRRVRTSERSLRGVLMMKTLFNPFKYGIYSFQLLSHNLLRRLNPFMLILFGVINLILITKGGVYLFTGIIQSVFYLLAVIVWLIPVVRKIPGISIPLYFVMGHAAIAKGVINMLIGKKSDAWTTFR